MDTPFQDLKFALRTLRRRRGFVAVAVMTMALGIGANTAIFSVVNGVLIKALPYPNPDRLVVLTETSKEVPETAVSYPDESVIGRSIRMNAETWTVIGVMPADFDFYGRLNVNNDFLVPLGRLTDREYMRDRNSHVAWVIGRLKPGVTVQHARTEMTALAARLEEQYPASNAGTGVALRSFSDDYLGEAPRALLVISAAVIFVLLIACANVANLLLARAAGRQKEIAVRLALGASRARIVRQLLTESVLLALAGGALGLILAAWSFDSLLTLSADALPRGEEVTIDPRVLLFTVMASLLTAIVFGLVPALQASKTDLHSGLKEGARQSTAGSSERLRGAFVVAEVALSFVLLAGAGLLLRSFREMLKVDLGFEPHNVLTVRLRLPDAKYRDSSQTMSFCRETLRRVSALPGVEHASLSTGFPFGQSSDNDYLIEGEPEPLPGDAPVAITHWISEDYQHSLGIELLAGRRFTAQDNETSPLVAIVDEELARRHFPAAPLAAVIGKRVRLGGSGDPWREIVGVVRHVKHQSLDEQPRPEIDRPYPQIDPKLLAEFTRVMDLSVKTSGQPLSFVAAVKGEVQSIDKEQPLANVRAFEDRMSEEVAPRRFHLLLVGVFAMIALVLAAVGVYGLMSYAVTSRTQEIGIRIALGAQSRDVLKLVLRRGLSLTLAGVGIGVAGALGVTRLMSSLLFGVSATDPLTFALISLLLTGVALGACFVPARRAMKVDPMVALRCE